MSGVDISAGGSESPAPASVPTGLPAAPAGMPVRSEAAAPAVAESTESPESVEGSPVAADGQAVEGTQQGDASADIVALAPEVQEFASALGFDPATIKDPKAVETIQALHAARIAQVEAALAQTIEQMREPAPEPFVEAEESPVELSPMQQVQQDFTAALQNVCLLHGCSSEAELRQQAPAAWQNLQEAYSSALRDAQVGEIQWIHSRETRKLEEARKEQERAEYARNLQAYAEGNLTSLQRENPSLISDLVETGTMAHVEKMAEAIGVAPEAMLADQSFCQYVATAAKAMRMTANLDKIVEAKVNERLAAYKKAAAAQTPATDSPVPSDVGLFARAGRYGRGVALI